MKLKLLIGFSLVQTALLALLASEVFGADRADSSPRAPSAEESEAASSPLFVDASPRAPTIEEIRRAVREEVAALAPRQASGTSGPAAAPPAQSFDPVVAAHAHRELDHYISRGRIGPREMQSLETKLAELPPGEQQKLLGNLAKAANEGRLKIQF